MVLGENYKIINLIGKGTFGQIYLCSDTLNKRFVAVKIIKNIKFKSYEGLKEANIHAVVDHKNIVKLYSSKIVKNKLILILEYCNGVTLTEYINQKVNVTEDEARDIFLQIIDAISYLHRNFIIHRDIKPDNIIITEGGVVKLIDFGFSDFYEPDKLMNKFCGTPIFTSPEVLKNKPYTGPEIDIWSIGICLYFMVHGNIPYNDDSLKNLIKLIYNRNLILRNDLSEEVVDILIRMLEKDGTKRITIEEIISHKWVVLVHNAKGSIGSGSIGVEISDKKSTKQRAKKLISRLFCCCNLDDLFE